MSPLFLSVRDGQSSEFARPLPAIGAGESISLTDHNPENPSVVIIGCAVDDDGGFVYRQALDNTKLLLGDTLRAIDLLDSSPEAIIPREGFLRFSITHRLGNEAILSIKHKIQPQKDPAAIQVEQTA